MKKRIIKTIDFENGELYGIIGGRRVLLARCVPKAEVYEYITEIPLLGQQGYKVKERHAGLVICPEPDTTRTVNADFLRAVTRFELSADVQRKDGIFETMRFDELVPKEIDLDEDWIFEIPEQAGIIKKLLGL